MTQTVSLAGPDGSQRIYQVFLAAETTWNPTPGCYAFAQKLPDGRFLIHYVGETGSFSDRLPTHERWQQAYRGGCRHILARVIPGAEINRKSEERDLIGRYNPRMNTVHSPTPIPPPGLYR